MTHAKGSSRQARRTFARLTLGLACLGVSSMPEALEPDKLFEMLSPSIVLVRPLNANETPLGNGSGVVVAPQTVITNCHVLSNAKSVQVKQGRILYEAKLEFPDPARDLCQLNVPDLKTPAVKLISSIKGIKVGQKAYAIGAPRGLELTLSDGLISAIRDYVVDDDTSIIQTTAAISPGSSGGGLFDSEGRLIGITTFHRKDSQNLNFAMPADWIKEIPQRAKILLEKEKEKRAAQSSTTASAATLENHLGMDEINALSGTKFQIVGPASTSSLQLAANGWFSAWITGGRSVISGRWTVQSHKETAQLCLRQTSGTTPIMLANISDCYLVQKNKNGAYTLKNVARDD